MKKRGKKWSNKNPEFGPPSPYNNSSSCASSDVDSSRGYDDDTINTGDYVRTITRNQVSGKNNRNCRRQSNMGTNCAVAVEDTNLASTSVSLFDCTSVVSTKPPHFTVSDVSDVELVVLTQPEEEHRARYLSEGSRGAVKDRSGNGHVVLQLKGLVGPMKMEVFAVNAYGDPEPHSLYKVIPISGKSLGVTPCRSVQYDDYECIEMQLLPEKDMTAVLDCVGILKLCSYKVQDKRARRATKNCSSIRLACRVTTQHPTLPGNMLSVQTLTEPIICVQQLGLPEVYKISLHSCPVVGGQEMFIVGKNFAKHCSVVFRELNKDERIIWSADAAVQLEYSHQCHMICTVPTYRDLTISDDVEVEMLIYCGKKESKPLTFIYTADTSDRNLVVGERPPILKRLRATDDSDYYSTSASQFISISSATNSIPSFSRSNSNSNDTTTQSSDVFGSNSNILEKLQAVSQQESTNLSGASTNVLVSPVKSPDQSSYVLTTITEAPPNVTMLSLSSVNYVDSAPVDGMDIHHSVGNGGDYRSVVADSFGTANTNAPPVIGGSNGCSRPPDNVVYYNYYNPDVASNELSQEVPSQQQQPQYVGSSSIAPSQSIPSGCETAIVIGGSGDPSSSMDQQFSVAASSQSQVVVGGPPCAMQQYGQPLDVNVVSEVMSNGSCPVGTSDAVRPESLYNATLAPNTLSFNTHIGTYAIPNENSNTTSAGGGDHGQWQQPSPTNESEMTNTSSNTVQAQYSQLYQQNHQFSSDQSQQQQQQQQQSQVDDQNTFMFQTDASGVSRNGGYYETVSSIEQQQQQQQSQQNNAIYYGDCTMTFSTVTNCNNTNEPITTTVVSDQWTGTNNNSNASNWTTSVDCPLKPVGQLSQWIPQQGSD